jgi:hemoglobin
MGTRHGWLGISLLVGLAVEPRSAQAQAETRTLYDRLGGRPAIEAAVRDFLGRALADSRINRKFAQSDPDRLRTALIQQICAATGGPCKYTGRAMREAHRNMGVTEGEFTALVEDLGASLDHLKVPAKEKGELLSALAPMKPDIVETKGQTTGTPLPRNFVPWKKPPG